MHSIHQQQRERRGDQCGAEDDREQAGKSDDEIPFGDQHGGAYQAKEEAGSGEPRQGMARLVLNVGALDGPGRGYARRLEGRRQCGKQSGADATESALGKRPDRNVGAADRHHEEEIVDGLGDGLNGAPAHEYT